MGNANRREFFRLSLITQDSTISILNCDEQNLVGKKYRGQILDLSAGGIRSTCDVDLPIRSNLTVQIHFTLMDRSYSLRAVPVRKVDNLFTFTYAWRFLNVPMSQQDSIISALNQLMTHRARLLVDDVDEDLE